MLTFSNKGNSISSVEELDVFPVNERVGTETSLGRLILVALFKLALEKLPPHCANSGSESSVMEPKVDRVTFPPTFSNLGNDRVSIFVYFSICILHRTWLNAGKAKVVR